MNFRIFILLLALSLVFSCRDILEDYDPGFEGQEYFPLVVGNTWIYQVDSVLYDNKGTRRDSISVKVKEVISDLYVDASGLERYTIERSEYNKESNNWDVYDIWSASADTRHAFRTEENLRFAKMNFPVKDGKTWDGNAFIDEDVIIRIAGEPIRVYQNWGNYQYTSIDENQSIGELNFEKVCTITQVDLEDKITRRYSLEKYAKGVGLVFKEMIILNTQKYESTDPWEVKAEEGFILQKSLLSFTQS